MKKSKTPRVRTKKSDKNLALISVILGAASLFNTIFTGIPAIVLGVVALRRNAGDRTQAKLGIALGIFGSLLIIPIIWLAIHFLRQPFHEQFAIPLDDRQNVVTIANALQEYQKNHKMLPDCTEDQTEKDCNSWVAFRQVYSNLPVYPLEFESQAYGVQDRPAGTLVYASRTTCFINVPTQPGTFDEENSHINAEDYSALIYFHSEGRSCFNVDAEHHYE